ncbi:MAG: hypothetical protein IH583_02925, partial [Candidatus Aminicenantes bacterium]|nr:hypothetical protein [Candidatus Aminicenantes bacterium]
NNIAPISTPPRAITRVRVTNLVQGIRGGDPTGLTVTIYFSNSGSSVWEFYRSFTGSGIANGTGFDWYEFKHFGTELHWKAVLTAPVDSGGKSIQSPYIDQINLEFASVEQREYARASAAATAVTQSGTAKKLIIGASFVFPGNEGQLRAYDVTNVSIAAGTTSVLQTITTSNLSSSTGRDIAAAGTAIFWDAGKLLAARTADSRVIYTAVRANSDLTNPLVRTAFTTANVGVLAGLLNDPLLDNSGLINFIRGSGRAWKLGDINRSSPAVVGPPSQDAQDMGDGYADFKAAYAGRTKVIYVGANDGMLHCFNVTTGVELWGFIPYNLLPKLQEMYAVDTDLISRYFKPSPTGFVDATPAVADVKIGNVWHTVLVCGQGPGTGYPLAGGLNYYWALDVTDPANPQPLWEITHTDEVSGYRTMGETRSTPVIGKIHEGGTDRWVAFMGSGYDNDASSPIAGTYFYAVRIDTGEFLRALPVAADVDTSVFAGPKGSYSYTNIAPAIVASPTAVDNDLDGFTDFVYVADLDGRIYRLDVSVTNLSEWALTTIYEDYLNYPIATKPAVWLNPSESTPKRPHIYVGTGGHDRNLGDYNPNTDELAALTFSFVSIIDNGTDPWTPDWVEWYIGDPALLGGLPTIKDAGDLGVGSRVWADPVIADMILYFSTIVGSIESANPCINLGAGSHLYARYLRQTSTIPAGGTAFRATTGTPPEYLQLISKARQAVTIGEAAYDETSQVNRREVYVQEYDSTIQQLVQPIGTRLRIRSWREVYRIIWEQ